MANIALERLKKQDILLMGVRCQKVSPSAFLEYLKEQKPGTYDDLDQWTVDDLEKAIDYFSSGQNLMVNHDQTIHQTANHPHNQSKFKSKMSFFITIGDKFFKEVFDCYKPQPADDLTDEVRIKDYALFDQGLLKQKYCKYRIETPSKGWVCNRRYKEFEALRECLFKEFPEILLPPLPKKEKVTDKIIQERMHQLELFLSNVLNNPLLKTSKNLHRFLSSEEEFECPEFEMERDFGKFVKLDGQVNVEIHSFLSKYYHGMTTYLEKTNKVYDKIIDNSAELFDSLQVVQDKLTNLNTSLKKMEQLSDQFNDKYVIGNIGILSQSYSLLEEYFSNWINYLHDMKSIYTGSFLEFFKFQKEMQLECLEGIKRRNVHEFNYLTLEEKLNKKKEDYYFNQPCSKWGIDQPFNEQEVRADKELAFSLMFSRETQQCVDQKEWFGMVNRQLLDSLTQYFDNKSVTYSNKFRHMIQNKKENLDQYSYRLQDIAFKLGEVIKLRNGESKVELNEKQIEKFRETISVTHVLGYHQREIKQNDQLDK